MSAKSNHFYFEIVFIKYCKFFIILYLLREILFSFVAGEFDLHLVIADNSEYNSAREDKIIRKFSQILAKKYALFFEFGKNEQFSIADYSKTIRR